MGVSLSRNTLTVEFDGNLWRATLGSDRNTGVTSVAVDPFTAIELTVGKAREKGWAFDGTVEAAEALKAEEGDGVEKTAIEVPADGVERTAELGPDAPPASA